MLFNLLSTYAVDKAEPIVKWLTIGVVVGIILTCLAVFIIKRDKFTVVTKGGLIGFVAYALIIGITMLVLDLIKHYDASYLEENWVSPDIIPLVLLPVLTTLSLALISFVVLFIVNKAKPEIAKKTSYVLGSICGVALIVTLVMMAIFYSQNIEGDGYYTDGYGNLNQTVLYISSALMVVGAIICAFIFGERNDKPFNSKSIVMAGICVSLSFALSFIKLFKLPFGGSVTLVSMLPIMVFAYVYGIKKGLIVGLVYGLLQALQDPFIVHGAQFLLDYPIAFAMTGFAGILSKWKRIDNLPQIKFAISAFIGGGLRYVAHVLSGVFAFGAYALDAGAENIWTYSIIYNTYVLIDVILVTVVGAIVFSSKNFRNEVEKLS